MAARAHLPGITLIEIVVVVALLAILAAVTIPQLAGAANDARETALAGNLVQARKQIAIYIAQHKGNGPHLDASGNVQAGEFVARMTGRTDADGRIDPQGPCGPYLPKWPANPFCPGQRAREVTLGADPAPPRDGRTGWYYCTTTCILSANSEHGAEKFDPVPAGTPAESAGPEEVAPAEPTTPKATPPQKTTPKSSGQ